VVYGPSLLLLSYTKREVENVSKTLGTGKARRCLFFFPIFSLDNILKSQFSNSNFLWAFFNGGFLATLASFEEEEEEFGGEYHLSTQLPEA
jgi:hypothetical protein